MNDNLKKILEKQSNVFLNTLRDAIENDAEEVCKYIDELTGLGEIKEFLNECDVLDKTTSYCYMMYEDFCNNKGVEPVHIKQFTQAIVRLKGYRLKTVFLDGSTRNVFIV